MERKIIQEVNSWRTKAGCDERCIYINPFSSEATTCIHIEHSLYIWLYDESVTIQSNHNSLVHENDSTVQERHESKYSDSSSRYTTQGSQVIHSFLELRPPNSVMPHRYGFLHDNTVITHLGGWAP